MAALSGLNRGKIEHFICKVNGIVVNFEYFAWDLEAPVYTDGSALCVGFPVAVGGAAAYQVALNSQGGYTVRSMVMALPIGFRISSGAAEHVAMHLACRGARKGPIALLVSDSAAIGKARLFEMEPLRGGKRQHAGFWEYPEKDS